ncbi:MAG: hypothetical protein H6887_08405 [Hoeflea sp.]|nr:hypothetical protein [Hoeflea sp.]
MASSPIVHEEVASQANTLIGEFADVETGRPVPERDIADGRPGRHLEASKYLPLFSKS